MAAICLVTLSTADAFDDLSGSENQALKSLTACYKAQKLHELVQRMDEDSFLRAVGELCTEERQHAVAMLAAALASNGTSKDEIRVRVKSFLLAHASSLRRFYKSVKGVP
jgi:hypothetical protein